MKTMLVKEKNNRKNFSKILFFVMIVLLLTGVFFYFLYRNEDEQKDYKSDNDNLEINNTDNNDNNADDNISSNDLDLLKTVKLSDKFQNLKKEIEQFSSYYSHQIYYEGIISSNVNPIKFKIENGNLVFYQLEKAQSMTTQIYDCEKVECKSQIINLNNEKLNIFLLIEIILIMMLILWV